MRTISYVVYAGIALGFLLPQADVLAPHAMWLLMGLLYFSFLGLGWEHLDEVRKRPYVLVAGLCLQYLVMPVVGLLVIMGLGIDDPVLASGFLLACVTPTGALNIVYTEELAGDRGQSTADTTLATALAPALVPVLAIVFIGQYVSVDPADLFIRAFLMVAVPLGLAKLTQKYVLPHREKLRQPKNAVLLVTVWAVTASASRQIIDYGLGITMPLLLVVITVLVMLLLAEVVGRVLKLPNPNRVSLRLTAIRKNTSLTFAMAIGMLAPLALLPILLLLMVYNVLTPLMGPVRRGGCPDP